MITRVNSPGGDSDLRDRLRTHGIKTTLAAANHGFVLAVELEPGQTLLAVDRFAVRSLCWRIVDGRLHVAERADELAQIDPPASISAQAVFDYLYFHVIPSPRTIFEGVFRLPAGHLGTFSQGAMKVEPYWMPNFEEPRDGDFAALAGEFRSLLERSVAAQLDGSKAACFLSGGTDSSTVAGMIREATGQGAASYSIGFEAEGYDEMAYARIAAKHFGCQHHEYYVTPADLVQGIPALARHFDQPFGNSSAVPAYYCAKLARDDGVTRILAGDGGDELFGGNARYAKQRVFGWYGTVPGPLRDALVEPLLLSTPLGRAPLLKKGASYVEQARVPMPDRLEMYNLLLRTGVKRVFNPEFLARVDQQGPAAQQRQVWGQAQAGSELNRTLAFDWRYTLAECDLPKVVGATSMAGVEVGFPFLDRELLAFSMRLPPEFKLKGLKLRWFFKEALRGFLPDTILLKKKHGFGLPFGVWLVRDAALRKLAGDSLHGLAGRGVERVEFVRALLDDLLPAHPGYYGEMVWILTMLEQWLRQARPRYDSR